MSNPASLPSTEVDVALPPTETPARKTRWGLMSRLFCSGLGMVALLTGVWGLTASAVEPAGRAVDVTDEVEAASDSPSQPATGSTMVEPDPLPSSPAEKSVSTLVLIFFMDEARRAVPSVIVEAGDSRFAIVGGPATIVPDGVGAAQDGAYLEVAGQAPLVAMYDERSTVDLRVHVLTDQAGKPVSRDANPEAEPARPSGGLNVWNPADRVEVAVGESLSAMGPHTRMRVQPDAVVVTALNRTVNFTPPALKTPLTHRGLIQVNQSLPEGTVLFKQGRLAGIVVLGRRFFGRDSQTAYVVPAKRIAELCEVLARTQR